MKISKMVVVCSFFFSMLIYAQPEGTGVSLSFACLYPQSPMKNFVSLAMRLWSEVRAAQMDDGVLHKLRDNSHMFAQEVLFLNSMLDMVVHDSSQKMQDCSECVEHFLHDFRYIIGVIYSLKNGYMQLMEHVESPDVMTTKFVLSSIVIKIQKILEGSAIS